MIHMGFTVGIRLRVWLVHIAWYMGSLCPQLYDSSFPK